MGSSFQDFLFNFIWRTGCFCSAAASLLIGFLYIKQDSLLYFPTIGAVPLHNHQNIKRYRSPGEHDVPFETHMITCEDGVQIHSWLLYHPEASSSSHSTIMFFHGNAGNIGMRLPNALQMYRLLKVNVWLVEYRGYGDSDGVTPNEKGLKLDAEAAWNYAHTNSMRGVDPTKLFVFGRSLGGAVAFHLAQYTQTTTHPSLKGVIVENTFTGISQMVDELMPLVAPFKNLVLRIGWNSLQIVPHLRTPTLFLAGDADELVPHSQMIELYKSMMSSARSPLVKMHVIKGGTHNESWAQGGEDYWRSIFRFMSDVFLEEKSVRSNADVDSGSPIKVPHTRSGPVMRKAGGVTAANSALSLDDCSESDASRTGSLEVMPGNDRDGGQGIVPTVGGFVGIMKGARSSQHNKKD
mmetsp:Transcript_10382/g.22506  ORF Transcript_10382/g.22506 Transcript_10382/m.22506 type:complete len:408 (+) Transcript_10382:262-1485(+)